MPLQLFANNVQTTISAVSTGKTSLTVASATGIPAISGGNWFYATICDTANPPTTFEIVKVTAVAGTTLTIVAGQDGTSDANWASGSVLFIGPTRQSMIEVQNDMLTTLVNAESAITGTNSPTAFDTMYLCSGTTADYTVSLPTSLTGLKNKIMGFRMDPGLTKLVTVDAGSGHLIDGQRTRIMWANEVALLKVNTDETNWAKVGGKSIPMSSAIGFSTDQNFSGVTFTLLTWSTNLYNNAPPAMQVTASYKIVILRPGRYQLTLDFLGATTNGTANNFLAACYKNGASFFSAKQLLPGGTDVPQQATFTGQMAVGDYLQPYGYFNGGSYSPTVFYNDSANPVYNALIAQEVPSW